MVVLAAPPPPTSAGGVVKRIRASFVPAPSADPVKFAKVPALRVRLEKTNWGVPEVRVTVTVELPAWSVSPPKVCGMTPLVLDVPSKVRFPPFITTLGRLPSVPKRSATKLAALPVALFWIWKVALRFTVMVFAAVTPGSVAPPVGLAEKELPT